MQARRMLKDAVDMGRELHSAIISNERLKAANGHANRRQATTVMFQEQA